MPVIVTSSYRSRCSFYSSKVTQINDVLTRNRSIVLVIENNILISRRFPKLHPDNSILTLRVESCSCEIYWITAWVVCPSVCQPTRCHGPVCPSISHAFMCRLLRDQSGNFIDTSTIPPSYFYLGH